MKARTMLTLVAVAAVAGGLAVAWAPPRPALSVQADLAAIPEVAANPLKIPSLKAEIFAAGVRTKEGKTAVQIVAVAPPEKAGAIIPLTMSWTFSSINFASRVARPTPAATVRTAETSLVIGPDGRAEAIIELPPPDSSDKVQTRDRAAAPVINQASTQAATPNGVNVRALTTAVIRNGFTLSSSLAEAPVTLWAEPELAALGLAALQTAPAVAPAAAPTTQPEQP